MKPFDIEISDVSKGPKELSYQLPIEAKVLRQIPGKDRDDYYIVELKNSVVWVDEKKNINTEVNYLVVCTKKKSQVVENDMKDVVLAIAYVKDEAITKAPKLDFTKIAYVADGKASAQKKWGLF